jgi:AraC-like DNA-binding protein
MGNPETVSFGLSLQGSCLSTNHNHQVVRNGEIRLIDLTSPYEKRHTGGSACSFEIPYTALGVSVDVARAALPHVAASPLHALAVSHLQMLPRVLDLPGSGRALPMLAESTAQLMKALVTSVTANDSIRRQGLSESQLARVDAYISQRVRDPDLSLAEIAASQFISLRQLYKLFAQRSTTPAEWIINVRLEGARDELARHPGTAISRVAANWGFRTAGHFTRRFSAAYGILPSLWAEQSRTISSPGQKATCALASVHPQVRA